MNMKESAPGSSLPDRQGGSLGPKDNSHQPPVSQGLTHRGLSIYFLRRAPTSFLLRPGEQAHEVRTKCDTKDRWTFGEGSS